MVSQLLFGEAGEVIAIEGDFTKIKTLNDNYTGWCQTAQLHDIESIVPQNKLLAGEWINKININGQEAYIPLGADLSFLQNNKAEVGKNSIDYKGPGLIPQSNEWTAESVRQWAYTFLNTPYLWGGRSVFGIDCSGFTQMVYKCFDKQLQRDASQQATQGEAIGFLQEVQTGDLAFFDNADGKITHVGLLLDSSTIIHSSGKVRVDTIDNMGIINTDTGKRTHSLRIIKRIDLRF
jgi:cell wall-associated NlpC family hydrolase